MVHVADPDSARLQAANADLAAANDALTADKTALTATVASLSEVRSSIACVRACACGVCVVTRVWVRVCSVCCAWRRGVCWFTRTRVLSGGSSPVAHHGVCMAAHCQCLHALVGAALGEVIDL